MESNIPFGKRCGFGVPAVNIGAMRLPEDHDEAVALIRSRDRQRHAVYRHQPRLRRLRDQARQGAEGRLSREGDSLHQVVALDHEDRGNRRHLGRLHPQAHRGVDDSGSTSTTSTSTRSGTSTAASTMTMAVAKGGMVDGIRKAMDDGLVGHTGFTTHDSVENLLTYIEEADWCEIILFTYNLLNDTYAPAIEAAHEKGIGTVIMNPVSGGMLAQPSSVLIELADQAGAASVPDLGHPLRPVQPQRGHDHFGNLEAVRRGSQHRLRQQPRASPRTRWR